MGIGLSLILICFDLILKKVSKNRFALPALAVGMGIYLPPSVNIPIVIGAILAWLINRHLNSFAKNNGKNSTEIKAKAERNGTLFAAGLIVGESLIGVVLAFIIAASVTSGGSDAPLALNLQNWDNIAEILGLFIFVVGIGIFCITCFTSKI